MTLSPDTKLTCLNTGRPLLSLLIGKTEERRRNPHRESTQEQQGAGEGVVEGERGEGSHIRSGVPGIGHVRRFIYTIKY